MINLLKEGDKSQFLDFLNTQWKKDHVFVKSELLFDYQHKSGDGYNFLITKREDKITSILGFIPSDSKGNHFWLAIWKSKSENGTDGISLLFKLEKVHFLKK